jgi:hypothetical protein
MTAHRVMEQNRRIVARTARHMSPENKIPIEFTCDFAVGRISDARDWLCSALPARPDEITIGADRRGSSDLSYKKAIEAVAEEVTRIECLFWEASHRFHGGHPTWEIGPLPADPDRAAGNGRPPDQSRLDLETLDLRSDFPIQLATASNQLETLALSPRRMNHIRVSARFGEQDSAKAARAAFAARYAFPAGLMFATEVLRYSEKDVRISLRAEFSSRRPDPALIARLMVLVGMAASEYGGEAANWHVAS